MQHSDHNGVRLFFDAPIVGSFELNGRTILTLCRRNLHDAIRDMKLLVEILPQKSIAKQEGNHAKPVVGMAGAECADGDSGVGGGVRGKAGR